MKTKRTYKPLRKGQRIREGDLYRDWDGRWKRTIWSNFTEGGFVAEGYPHKRRTT